MRQRPNAPVGKCLAVSELTLDAAWLQQQRNFGTGTLCFNSVASGLADYPEYGNAPRKEVNECTECENCRMLSVHLGIHCSLWWCTDYSLCGFTINRTPPPCIKRDPSWKGCGFFPASQLGAAALPIM